MNISGGTGHRIWHRFWDTLWSERGTDMRQIKRSNHLSLAGVFLVLACLLGGPLASRAWADDPRAEAKAHYQAGVKLYSTGDYRGAVKEFSAAQQLAPADLNNYN